MNFKKSFSELNKRYNFLDPEMVSLSSKSFSRCKVNTVSSSYTLNNDSEPLSAGSLSCGTLNIMPALLQSVENSSTVRDSSTYMQKWTEANRLNSFVPIGSKRFALSHESHNSTTKNTRETIRRNDFNEEVFDFLKWEDESFLQSSNNSKRYKKRKQKKKKNGKLNPDTEQSENSSLKIAKPKIKGGIGKRFLKEKKMKILKKKKSKQNNVSKKPNTKGMISKEELNTIINKPVVTKQKLEKTEFMRLADSPSEGQDYLQLLKRLLELSNSYINHAISTELASSVNVTSETNKLGTTSLASESEPLFQKKDDDEKESKKLKGKKKIRKKIKKMGKKLKKIILKKPATVVRNKFKKFMKKKKKKKKGKKKVKSDKKKVKQTKIEGEKILSKQLSSDEFNQILSNAITSYKKLIELKQKYSGHSETVTLDQAMLLAHDNFLKILVDSLKNKENNPNLIKPESAEMHRSSMLKPGSAEMPRNSLIIRESSAGSGGAARRASQKVGSTTSSTAKGPKPSRATTRKSKISPKSFMCNLDKAYSTESIRTEQRKKWLKGQLRYDKLQDITDEGRRKRLRRKQSFSELVGSVPELMSPGTRENYAHVGPKVYQKKSTLDINKLKLNPCTLFFFLFDIYPSYPQFLHPFERYTSLKTQNLPFRWKRDRRLIAIEKFCKVRFLMKPNRRIDRMGLRGIIVQVLARRCEDIAKAMRCIELHLPKMYRYIIFSEKICERSCGQLVSINDDDFYRRLRNRCCFKTSTADFMETQVIDSFQGPYWAILRRFMEEKMYECRDQKWIVRSGSHEFARPLVYENVEFL